MLDALAERIKTGLEAIKHAERFLAHVRPRLGPGVARRSGPDGSRWLVGDIAGRLATQIAGRATARIVAIEDIVKLIGASVTGGGRRVGALMGSVLKP